LKTWRIAILVILLVSRVTAVAFPAPVPDTIQVQAGFQAVIDTVSATRISIGNPDLVEARPLPGGGGVLVVGKKEGETDLVIWDRKGRNTWKVLVVPGKVDAIRETESFIRDFPGLKATLSGSTVLVSGFVASREDKTLVEKFAAAHEGVLTRITLPEDAKRLLSYDLKIIELSKGATSQIGIRFPDAVQAVASWSNSPGSLFSVGSQFEARLNMLMADGKARILANPRILCESGSTADFLAGGEIPIVLITTETRTVQWKSYGIIMKLSPVTKNDNTISTVITVEISTIDHGSGSSEIPAFLTRRVSTVFSSASGNTVMLSGLIRSESAKDVARVPLIGQIPILGELFKSRSFRENQTELAIFITPSELKADRNDSLDAWEEKSRQSAESLRFRLID
jgi:pilus assembly protein CpaC